MAAESPASVAKEEYFKVVSAYKTNFKHITQKDLMSKRWVDIMIQRIENARKIIALQNSYASLHATVKETLKSYDISVINQKEVLVFKPDPDNKNLIIIIVPLEETFEVVEDAHLRTNHGTQEEMKKWIQHNNYLMHSMCIPAYFKLCKKCSGKTSSNIQIEQPLPNPDTPEIMKTLKSKLDTYEHVVTLDVLDLSTRPDNYYNFLLIYEDKKTGLIQLRPMNNNAEADIAIELIKILMDFSIPQCMAIDPENMELYNMILNKVTALCGRKIALAIFNIEDNDKLMQRISKNIIRWMEEEDCQNWGIGCYMVQWKLNNTPDEQGITPFSRVFACDQPKMMTKNVLQSADEDSEMITKQKSSEDSMNEKHSLAIEKKVQCPSSSGIENMAEHGEGYIVTLTEEIKPDKSPCEKLQSDFTPIPEMKYEMEDE